MFVGPIGNDPKDPNPNESIEVIFRQRGKIPAMEVYFAKIIEVFGIFNGRIFRTSYVRIGEELGFENNSGIFTDLGFQ